MIHVTEINKIVAVRTSKINKIVTLVYIIFTFALLHSFYCLQQFAKSMLSHGNSKWEPPNGNFQTGTPKREPPNGNFQTWISKREHPNGNPQIEASKRELPDGNQSLRSYRTRSRAMPRRLYIYAITSWLCHGCELVKDIFVSEKRSGIPTLQQI